MTEVGLAYILDMDSVRVDKFTCCNEKGRKYGKRGWKEFLLYLFKEWPSHRIHYADIFALDITKLGESNPLVEFLPCGGQREY